MKVLLINPWEGEVFPSPSIGYLQAAIKTARPDIRVEAKDLTEAISALNTIHYDLVAVSFHSFSVKHARMIRSLVKGRLICGGHHPSLLPAQMLSIGYDQVVIGEGESAIVDIIEGNNSPTIKEFEKRFVTINDIPFPDYTGLKYDGTTTNNFFPGLPL